MSEFAEFRIERATLADLPAMTALYAHARQFMAEQGNPSQWGDSYPDEAQLTEDIQSGGAWLCRENGALLAAFYLAPGPDEDYAVIRDGSWLEEERPYWVIHRVASYGGKGAAAWCLDWCWQRCDNLRIDTHRDNLPMQRLLEKCGFGLRGVVSCHHGGERLAYQKLR